MKKIFSLISMATLAMSFVACGDNDDLGAAYNRASTISVVKSDVLFSAAAGTGSVVVKAQGPIALSGSSEWCKATALNDSTIEVSVDNNESNVGRSNLLTIKSGVDSVNVTVQQQGFYLQTGMGTAIAYGDDSVRKAYAFSTSGSPVITSTEDWLTATVEGDSLVVTAAANETGHVRRGYVKYTFGEFKDSVMVSQYDFEKDLAGAYYFCYYKSNGKSTYMSAELKMKDGKPVIYLPKYYGFNIPVTIDETCKLSIAEGADIGTCPASDGTTFYVAIVLGNSAANRITWSGGRASYSASFKYNETSGTYAMFKDNGSWKYKVDYMSFYYFKANTFASADLKGNLVDMYNPYLMKK